MKLIVFLNLVMTFGKFFLLPSIKMCSIILSKDYKELHILRKIFPHVPIMALTATCGPRVLKDLISILGLKEVVSGEGNVTSHSSAATTLNFSAKMLRHSARSFSVRPCIAKIFIIA